MSLQPEESVILRAWGVCQSKSLGILSIQEPGSCEVSQSNGAWGDWGVWQCKTLSRELQNRASECSETRKLRQMPSEKPRNAPQKPPEIRKTPQMPPEPPRLSIQRHTIGLFDAKAPANVSAFSAFTRSPVSCKREHDTVFWVFWVNKWLVSDVYLHLCTALAIVVSWTYVRMVKLRSDEFSSKNRYST